MLSIVKLVSLFAFMAVLYGNAFAQEADNPPPIPQDKDILANTATFYTARSEPEKEVARFLKFLDELDEAHFNNTDKKHIGYNLSGYVFGRPDRDVTDDFIFDQMFTTGLRDAWRQAQRDFLEEYCDGKYTEGDDCTMDGNPLTCAQDTSDYLFRTEYLTDKRAIVSYHWVTGGSDTQKPTASYYLIKKNDRWVFDGVTCLWPGFQYNWPK